MKDSTRLVRSSWFSAVGSLALALCIGACGSSEPPPPPPVKDTVFGGLVGTKDKAKTETEKAMEANQKKLEEAVKKQEREAAQ